MSDYLSIIHVPVPLFLSGFPLLEPRDLQAESQIKYLAGLITIHSHISFQR